MEVNRVLEVRKWRPKGNEHISTCLVPFFRSFWAYKVMEGSNIFVKIIWHHSTKKWRSWRSRKKVNFSGFLKPVMWSVLCRLFRCLKHNGRLTFCKNSRLTSYATKNGGHGCQNWRSNFVYWIPGMWGVVYQHFTCLEHDASLIFK